MEQVYVMGNCSVLVNICYGELTVQILIGWVIWNRL